MAGKNFYELREKITRRKSIEFLMKLEGLHAGRLALADEYEIPWHHATMKRNAAYASEANFSCPIENTADPIFEKFEDFSNKRGGELLLLCGQPFIFDLSVKNPASLIRSFCRARSTKVSRFFPSRRKRFLKCKSLNMR